MIFRFLLKKESYPNKFLSVDEVNILVESEKIKKEIENIKGRIDNAAISKSKLL